MLLQKTRSHTNHVVRSSPSATTTSSEISPAARLSAMSSILDVSGRSFFSDDMAGGVRFNPQDLREAGCTSLFGSGSWPGDHLTGQRITEAPSEAEGIGWSSTFVTARSSNGQNLVEFFIVRPAPAAR